MKKISALICAVAMLFTLASCGEVESKEQQTTKSENVSVADAIAKAENADETEEKDENVSDEFVTDEDGEALTDKSGKEITEKVTKEKEKKDEKESTSKSEKATSKNTSSVPKTKSEIIEYSNAALNRVKFQKAGYTKKAVMSVNGSIDGIPSWLVSIFQKDKTTTMSKGADNRDDFPAAGYDWSSKLREQDVESATINVSGKIYDIMIKLGTEKNPAKGTASSYGRVMSVIDAAEAADLVPGLSYVDMLYHDGYIHLKTDSVTGNVIFAELSATADAKAKIAVIGEIQAKDIKSTETYTSFVW